MITKLKQEIAELNKLIREKTNQKQSVINRWQYLKHGKEAQVKVLEKVIKLIDKGCNKKFNWAKCESRKCGEKTLSYLYLCPRCKKLKLNIK